MMTFNEFMTKHDEERDALAKRHEQELADFGSYWHAKLKQSGYNSDNYAVRDNQEELMKRRHEEQIFEQTKQHFKEAEEWGKQDDLKRQLEKNAKWAETKQAKVEAQKELEEQRKQVKIREQKSKEKRDAIAKNKAIKKKKKTEKAKQANTQNQAKQRQKYSFSYFQQNTNSASPSNSSGVQAASVTHNYQRQTHYKPEPQKEANKPQQPSQVTKETTKEKDTPAPIKDNPKEVKKDNPENALKKEFEANKTSTRNPNKLTPEEAAAIKSRTFATLGKIEANKGKGKEIERD